MYSSCTENYAEWKALAENQLRQSIGMAQLRAVQEGSTRRGSRGGEGVMKAQLHLAEMRGLLRRMQSLAVSQI
jgi:hypothetical protein